MTFNVIILDMPSKAKGFTKYNSEEDFYTIFLNAKLNYEQQQSAFEHEIRHIEYKDFNRQEAEKAEVSNNGRKHHHFKSFSLDG